MRSIIKHCTSCLALAAALAATLASCSKDEDPNKLPDGKYPMTFTAAVEGLTATRATTDGQWAGSEEVAVQVGSEVKRYTAAAGGALSSTTPLYWQSTANINVTAWHPYSEAKPATFTVLADQSNNTNFQQSDLIYASQEVTFKNPTLTFKHLPVKVVVNLKSGDGVTADEVQSATVSIVNQNLTSGTIGEDWSVTQTSGSSSITPAALAPASGAQKSVQALLVPQQMQGEKFIKVTINGGNYYYTPTVEGDANLTAGKQYTYTITVKKNGITVTASGATDWAGTTSDVTSKEVKQAFTASDLKIGDYYYSDGTTSDGGYREYTDGTKTTLPIMPVLTDASNKPRTVVGIVFWVGDPTNNTDGDPLLAIQHPGCIHGLVVALQDAGGNSHWSDSYEDITANWLQTQTTYVITSLKVTDKMQGYANTQALIGYNTTSNVQNNSNLKVLPIEAITTYASAHPTPASSSGWYFPSVMELKYMCWGQGNSKSTTGRDLLNGQFAKAGGTNFGGSSPGGYWSSSEHGVDGYYVWYVDFFNGNVGNYRLKDVDESWVRALFAF